MQKIKAELHNGTDGNRGCYAKRSRPVSGPSG
jgi:hypothetical protein